jgi:hypothetical protein
MEKFLSVRILGRTRVSFLLWLCLSGGFRLCAAETHLHSTNLNEAVKPLARPAAAPGTLRMAERLRELDAKANVLNQPFLNDRIVAYYQEQLKKKISRTTQRSILAQLPRQLLQAGRTVEAIQALDEFEAFLKSIGQTVAAQDQPRLLFQRGLAHLRLGEQQNCQLNHTTESCLFPIGPGGVHRRPEGSREAVRLFTELLKQRPTDLSARWLLNIGYMTMGEYPEHVPSEWLIPPALLAAEYDIKHFPDVAGLLGLDVDDLAGGSIVEDFDNDGNLDILISCWRLDAPMHFFWNDGHGHFVDRTEAAGLSLVTGGLNIMQADYNNDGFLDVLILRGGWLGAEGHHPNSLLRNNGDGTFADVTEEAGLLSFHPTQAATWFDFNNDGWLDLFIANESYLSDTNACELFRNNRDGTFTECAAASGVARMGFFKGVASGDYNNDGRPDLFLSNRQGRTVLLRNDGPVGTNAGPGAPWHFTDVAAAAGVALTQGSFPTWFFDYDNDGRLDLFVCGYAITDVGDVAADYLGMETKGAKSHLFHNNGDGTFSDVSVATKLSRVIHGMGANYGDLDNDGWLDFYVGTGDPNFGTLIPNRMFRNAGGKLFQEVTASGGFGHLQKGHGISFADIDNDGDQDIYEVIGGAYTGDNYRNALFLNPGHSNHWVGLKLVGTRSNRAAIGARIKVVAQTASGTRDIYKTVNSGGSFGSSPLRQQIGLEKASSIERVEIYWPVTGQTQIIRGLEPDRFYLIREDATQAVALRIPAIALDFKGTREPFCATPQTSAVTLDGSPSGSSPSVRALP